MLTPGLALGLVIWVEGLGLRVFEGMGYTSMCDVSVTFMRLL